MSLTFLKGPEAESPLVWYAQLDGRLAGPFSTQEMQCLHRSQAVTATTLVWQSSGWRRLESTGLGFLSVDLELPIDGQRSPPLLSVRTLAYMPFVGVLAAILLRMNVRPWACTVLWLTLALDLLCAEVDLLLLRRAGFDTSRMGLPIFVPAYLFQRARTLRHGLHHVVVWLAGTASTVTALLTATPT